MPTCVKHGTAANGRAKQALVEGQTHAVVERVHNWLPGSAREKSGGAEQDSRVELVAHLHVATGGGPVEKNKKQCRFGRSIHQP